MRLRGKPCPLSLVILASACLVGGTLCPAAAAADPPAPSPAASQPKPTELIPMLVQEIRNGLKDRGVGMEFARFQAYAGRKLDRTAGLARTSEVTGNCRLSWYDRLLRNPLSAPAEAEQFTRTFHEALSGDTPGLDRALAMAREKMDAGRRQGRKLPAIQSPQQALDAVQRAVVDAQTAFAAAVAPLSRSELGELTRGLYPVLLGQNREGHTLIDRSTGRRLCDLLEKMDRQALWDAADAMIPLSDPALLAELAKLPDEGRAEVPGVSGEVRRQLVTPAGVVVVGGSGANVYDLERMPGVCAVIDLGGDDVYREGVVSLGRPVLAVIDLAGNDRYQGTSPGIQGAAILGVSLLLDAAGNDVYEARDVAQASALGGIGILIDLAGDDAYRGVRRVQGHALGGLGLLLDRAGKDDYRAAMWGQGFGAPLGFGALEDVAGNDHYFMGGAWPDSYPETPGCEGWGQGVGAGIRQSACGGIGVLLEGAGDDVYESDYMSHGGGYWLGLGFARDFAGNDRRYAGTRTAFGGGPRTEPVYTRFTCGFGCHYALGFCFDDVGDDTYGGTIMGLGHGWDCSVGVLGDFAGNDRYEAAGGNTQGCGAQGSLGILFDYSGNDAYSGWSQGYANPSISYHSPSECGGNFSFLVDYGGTDTYGCGAKDNTLSVRGTQGGFVIDRPLPGEPTSPPPAQNAGASGPQPSAASAGQMVPSAAQAAPSGGQAATANRRRRS